MIFNVCQYTSVGGREHNEDNLDVIQLEDSMILSVADGLGGHACGEVASATVLETLRSQIAQPMLAETLCRAMECANDEVVRRAKGNNMKTTLVTLWLGTNGKALVGNVGDSRLYQFRNSEIQFQSRDHSLAQLDMMAGESHYRDVRDDPDRNKLIRVLGVKNGFKADIEEIEFRTGDAFLLCSDGFWENIYEAEMLDAWKQSSSAKEWMANMRRVLQLRLNTESDNNTAITIIIR